MVKVVLSVVTVVVVVVVVVWEVVLVVVIVVIVVVVRALTYAGVVIATFAKILTADMGADVFIVVSNALVDSDVNALAVPINDLGFAMSETLEEFRCWSALDCRSMVALNCDHVLQARMPAYHV